MYQVDFWGTRGSQPDALRDHSGTVLAPNRRQKSILATFATTGLKTGFGGLSGRFSDWSRVPISIFFGSVGDQGVPGAVAGLQRADADKAPKRPW